MRLKTSCIATVLVEAAAALTIAAAPTAMADPASEQSCAYLGGSSTQCQRPGNVQINDSPPYVQYTPQYPYYWDGDSFSHGGFGGGREHR